MNKPVEELGLGNKGSTTKGGVINREQTSSGSNESQVKKQNETGGSAYDPPGHLTS